MLLEVVELLQHMVTEVLLLVLRRKSAPWKLEDLLGLEFPHSQDQLLEVLDVQQEASHLHLLEMPPSGSACSEDPVELVVVGDAFVVSGAGGSATGGGRAESGGRGGCAGVIGVAAGS